MASALRVGLFASLLFVACVIAYPTISRATGTQADQQCQPGGKIGQKCTDNTHGYKTQGKCAYVYVCKADSVPSNEPPLCTGGGKDCPVGGPSPSNFNPYPKAIKIASGSPSIPTSSISDLEKGVLGAAFASDEATPTDLADLSASANVSLKTILDAQGEDSSDALAFVPESFQKETSTLFAGLRENAVTLGPGQKPTVAVDALGNVRLAFPSNDGTSFGATFDASSDENSTGISFADDLILAATNAPRHFALGFYHAGQAALMVVLADFSSARAEWNVATENLTSAAEDLWNVLRALWEMLVQFIQRSVTAYAQEDDANADCTPGEYRYEYTKRDAPCDKEKCMLHAPCAGSFARGICASEGKCNATSVKICDSNSGTCSWTTPQQTALPGSTATPSTPLPPPVTGDQPLPISPELQNAFSDNAKQQADAQARIDAAQQKLMEAFNNLQNDPQNYSARFDDVRSAQKELLDAQRALNPTLKDYLLQNVAPRMTPTELLPDGNSAPIMRYEWINNLGSAPAPFEAVGSQTGFAPFKVAQLGDGPPIPLLSDEALQNELELRKLSIDAANELRGGMYAPNGVSPFSFAPPGSLTMPPEEPLTVTNYSFDSISDAVTAGVKCLFGTCPTPLSNSVPFGGLNSIADFGLTEPFVVSGNLTEPQTPPWTGETSLTEPELKKLLEQEGKGPPLPTAPTPTETAQPSPKPQNPQTQTPQPTPQPQTPERPATPSAAPSGKTNAGTGGFSLQSLLPSLWSVLANLFNYLRDGNAANTNPSTPQNPPAPAPTASLSIDPSRISIGTVTRLMWSCTNADSSVIYLSDGTAYIRDGVNGTATTSPLSVTTTFRLVCSGHGGSAENSSTVTVQ